MAKAFVRPAAVTSPKVSRCTVFLCPIALITNTSVAMACSGNSQHLASATLADTELAGQLGDRRSGLLLPQGVGNRLLSEVLLPY